MQAQRSDAMEYNPVVWFEIYVEDMKRAKTFSEGLLDVALEEAKMEGVEM
jgi:predicted enzyme related to lactoylglutathione lyase